MTVFGKIRLFWGVSAFSLLALLVIIEKVTKLRIFTNEIFLLLFFVICGIFLFIIGKKIIK